MQGKAEREFDKKIYRKNKEIIYGGNKMKYSEIRSDLRTGDMVLFSGKGFISWIIKKFTRSKWSHVGLVVVDRNYDMVLLWESTTLSKVKTVVGKIKRGVAIRPLSEVVKNYKGIVGFRLLGNRLKDTEIETLIELRRKFKNRGYEASRWELFKSAYDWVGGENKRDTSTLFCSELVIEFYQAVEFIWDGIPSNEFTPEDCANLSLSKNRLSPIVLIKRG